MHTGPAAPSTGTASARPAQWHGLLDRLARTPAARPLPGALSGWLDAARGTAALAVVAGHLRALLFVNYADLAPGQRTRLVALAYAGTGFGHQAVIVFFVLSGLLISRSVVGAAVRDRWSWAWYAEQRLTRLYVVLVPALLLTAAWDRAGIALLGAGGVYGGSAKNTVLTFATTARHGLAVFAASLCFLQEIVAPPYGSNAPLWSLSYEFWYYVAFPACLFAVVARRPLARVAAALAAATVLAFVGPAVRAYFAVWLLGFAAILPPAGRVGRRPARGLAVLAVAGVLAALGLTRANVIGGATADFVLGVACAALLAAALQLTGAAPGPDVTARAARRGGAARALAGFSYTLYLVHLPPLVLVSGLLTADGRAPWQPDAAHGALALLVGVIVVGYAYGIAQVTEARTERVRVALRTALGRLGRAAALSPGRPSPETRG